MSNKYIDYSLTHLSSVIHAKLFPNSKEITESVGAWFAFRKHFPMVSLGNKNVTVYVPGDGSTPRTAAVFAKLSNFTVYSIDPRLKDKLYFKSVDEKWPSRVHVHSKRTENFHINPNEEEKQLSMVIAVHSHAPFQELWDRIPSPKIGIAIPCCFDQSISTLEPLLVYEDTNILSEKNKVFIWKQD